MRRGPGVVRIGRVQFCWRWSGKEPNQWPWWTEDGSGYLLFYGVAFGDTFIGVVR